MRLISCCEREFLVFLSIFVCLCKHGTDKKKKKKHFLLQYFINISHDNKSIQDTQCVLHRKRWGIFKYLPAWHTVWASPSAHPQWGKHHQRWGSRMCWSLWSPVSQGQCSGLEQCSGSLSLCCSASPSVGLSLDFPEMKALTYKSHIKFTPCVARTSGGNMVLVGC